MDVMKWVRLQWDRVGAWICVVAGAVSLLIGWLGVSGTAYPAEQLPYIISAGLGGIFLLGLAAILWLSADLRDEWRKLDRIEMALLRGGHPEPPKQEVAATDPTGELDVFNGGTSACDDKDLVGAESQRSDRPATTAARSDVRARAKARSGEAPSAHRVRAKKSDPLGPAVSTK